MAPVPSRHGPRTCGPIFTPVGGTPKQLGDFIAAETRKWQQVVKVSGAKVD